MLNNTNTNKNVYIIICVQGASSPSHIEDDADKIVLAPVWIANTEVCIVYIIISLYLIS